MEVTGDGVRVRAGPGTEHGVVGVLSLGQRVTVTERAGGWARVEVPGRQSGWSASRYLTPVE
jgi:N-acetylmuramoyl-L-alanine amidase